MVCGNVMYGNVIARSLLVSVVDHVVTSDCFEIRVAFVTPLARTGAVLGLVSETTRCCAPRHRRN